MRCRHFSLYICTHFIMVHIMTTCFFSTLTSSMIRISENIVYLLFICLLKKIVCVGSLAVCKPAKEEINTLTQIWNGFVCSNWQQYNCWPPSAFHLCFLRNNFYYTRCTIALIILDYVNLSTRFLYLKFEYVLDIKNKFYNYVI